MKDGSIMPIDRLSDGLKNMLAMVGDIAYRCYSHNPHLGQEALTSPGIVLIDELDLHLHPRWQQHVVNDLKMTFPNIQFIATTHSPIILSCLDSEDKVILLDDNEVQYLTHTGGRDVNDILSIYMDAEIKNDDLDRYFQLIESGVGQSDEALALHSKIEQASGADYHELAHADLLLSFYEWYMIYIDKKRSEEPTALKEYIDVQTDNQLELSYKDIPKDAVRAALLDIQGGLCCYCMNRIGKDNFAIEHFLPQAQAENYQVAFHNLFLACQHSNGKRQGDQHCDKAKGDKLIPNYFSSKNCASYFAYSQRSGEILPCILTVNGEPNWEHQKKFISAQDYQQKYLELSDVQRMVLVTIDTLKLYFLDWQIYNLR